jgi:hypothetical protein
MVSILVRQSNRRLPTYAWAIEHREGVIVVDTGQGAHLLESARSYHIAVSQGAEARCSAHLE